MHIRLPTLLLLAGLLAGCVGTPSPTPAPPTEIPPTPAPQLATQTPVAATLVPTIPPASLLGPYGVILVLPGDLLNIRAGPGADHAIVGTFAATATNVTRTGPSNRVALSTWVEVLRPDGGRGWVNARYLSEYVPPPDFCADERVTDLLEAFRVAAINADGARLAELVSPLHGLDVRYWHHGTVAHYSRSEVRSIFRSNTDTNWGADPGSGQDTVGTFRQVVFPKLQDGLGGSPKLNCSIPQYGGATYTVAWPPEYANINFYSLYKPGSDAFGNLDWRTWLVGIEYVDGQPYLFALVHFQWEP